GDSITYEELNLTQNEKEMIEHIIIQMEEESGMDRAAAIADMRFSFIQRVCRASVVKPGESKEHRRSRHIDEFLTGKFTAIPAFIAIMALVFWLSFNVVGAWLQDLCAAGVDLLTEAVARALEAANVNGVLYGLIIDGAFQGVGAVISFVPIILCLFFFLSMLEDSGYMVRIAFVTDKLLRKIGLSGRSIVPMLIGFGCSVPAIMASRTLPSERDRKMTIMMTPFMSCTAKLPIYGFFCNLFFPEHAGLIMVGLYFLGIVTGILLALISKSTVFRGEAVPFVMELPNYRLPGLKNVGLLLWDKAKDFLQRAFTIIFLASIIVWALQSFDFSLNLVADSKDSILAGIAGVLAPIFTPQGFGDWRIVTSLIAGFMAKESVVSTLTVLFGEAGLTAVLGVSSAASLLTFCLLYTPCVAAIASVRRELGRKWALAMIVLQCGVAWGVSLIVALIV
ncbi:MAG: ferrous iron transport protein B, partial [Firmicutes bacterium]|nr:ferrous iron transport protein B [Bacillota bacterium]